MWFHIPDYDKPDPYNNLIERFISYYKERRLTSKKVNLLSFLNTPHK